MAFPLLFAGKGLRRLIICPFVPGLRHCILRMPRFRKRDLGSAAALDQAECFCSDVRCHDCTLPTERCRSCFESRHLRWKVLLGGDDSGTLRLYWGWRRNVQLFDCSRIRRAQLGPGGCAQCWERFLQFKCIRHKSKSLVYVESQFCYNWNCFGCFVWKDMV